MAFNMSSVCQALVGAVDCDRHADLCKREKVEQQCLKLERHVFGFCTVSDFVWSLNGF